ncbi:unnamed protein product [Anisakis simplex]|uniref:Protein NipSnap (inferred by orthology to a D. melanogaster protein) n=1 Tax=Anisakis simplex TaxID=6269 RepID=A0A158PMX6_ANISI|nr:unnamed protein product [Anisakis simplex]
MNHLPFLSCSTCNNLSFVRSQASFSRLYGYSSVANARYYSQKPASGDDSVKGTSVKSSVSADQKKETSSESGAVENKKKTDGSKDVRKQGLLSRILIGSKGVSPRYLQSHSSILSDSGYIYELVTHDAIPGERENYLKLYKNYANELHEVNADYSLLGSWRVYYPNRDQSVHLWRYNNGYESIDRTMNALLTMDSLKKVESEMGRLLLHRDNVLAKSFSYWGEPEPRPASNIYELRAYTLRPGTLIEWGAAWAKGIEYRREANQDVGGFFTQMGPLHRVYHLWAYDSLAGRNDTRQKSWAKPGWDETVAHTAMSTNPFDEDYHDYTGALSASGRHLFFTGYVFDFQLMLKGPTKNYTSVGNNSVEDDVNYYEREIEKYMQESLDSTQRSRRQLDQSEQIGVATAQDLLTQREKLENAEKNLEEIDKVTKMTQRNLNSLKSVFGGFFKNKFSRAPKENNEICVRTVMKLLQKMSSSKSDNRLNKTVDKLTSADSTSSYTGGAVSASGPTLSESSRAAIKGTRWETMDNEIDSNLDSMSSQLARLRDLGSAIGDEVDSQNELLDRIQMKAERNDSRVKDQDTQMRRILGNVEKQDEQKPAIPTVSKRK